MFQLLQFFCSTHKTHFVILWDFFITNLATFPQTCLQQKSHSHCEKGKKATTPRGYKTDSTKETKEHVVLSSPGTSFVAPRKTSNLSSCIFHWRPSKDAVPGFASKDLIVFSVSTTSSKDSITVVLLLSHLIKLNPPFRSDCFNCWYKPMVSSSVSTGFAKLSM